jgi:hypothetical protein
LLSSFYIYKSLIFRKVKANYILGFNSRFYVYLGYTSYQTGLIEKDIQTVQPGRAKGKSIYRSREDVAQND